MSRLQHTNWWEMMYNKLEWSHIISHRLKCQILWWSNELWPIPLTVLVGDWLLILSSMWSNWGSQSGCIATSNALLFGCRWSNITEIGSFLLFRFSFGHFSKAGCQWAIYDAHSGYSPGEQCLPFCQEVFVKSLQLSPNFAVANHFQVLLPQQDLNLDFPVDVAGQHKCWR